jgi:hypothetical protein
MILLTNLKTNSIPYCGSALASLPMSMGKKFNLYEVLEKVFVLSENGGLM